jgi:NAD(P)-dependent dehydrogenase (short-subunit alcohol dehydrogenase family)
MGGAIAAQLASEAWPLVLCDLQPERLEMLKGELRTNSPSVELLAGDIGDVGYVARLDAVLASRDVGVFIHAAGLSPTMADATRILRVNFDATARLVEMIRPKMVAGGCVVLIASSAGHMVKSVELDRALDEAVLARSSDGLKQFAPNSQMAYTTSKRAVIRLVAQEAGAFGKRGARIVSISPGLIDTAMTRSERAASTQMDGLLARTPLGRLGTANEIASVAVFLCSKGASYITGCDIRVDGGTLAALGL